MTDKQHVIVAVDGIQTFGQWQDRLRRLVTGVDSQAVFEIYKYGFFSVLAFIVPVFRWLAVRQFRKKAAVLFANYPGARFSFVGHSFGTHILTYGLRGMKPEELPEIDIIILSGSVLRSQFDWDKFRKRVPARRVLNYCGANNSVLVLSQAGVLFTGMAGRVGFYGFTGNFIVNRIFSGGHSHYFNPVGADPDSFMREHWLPVLTSRAEPDATEVPAAKGLLNGIQQTLLRLADPLKVVSYGLVGWLLLDVFYFGPRLEARTQQASGEVTAAASLLEVNRLLPEILRLAHARDFERQPAGQGAEKGGRQRRALHGAAVGSVRPCVRRDSRGASLPLGGCRISQGWKAHSRFRLADELCGRSGFRPAGDGRCG